MFRRFNFLLEKSSGKEISGLKKIMFQGDSVTDAGRDRSDVHNLAGYSLELSKIIKNKYELVNYACSGDTSNMMLERHIAEFEKEKPDYLFVLIGINDVWRYYAESEEYYKQRVTCHKFIENVKNTVNISKKIKNDCQIFIIEPFLLDGTSNLKKIAIAKYNKYVSKLKEVVLDLPVTYIETNVKMNLEQENGNILSDDGVHPNENGHKYIATLIKDYLE